MTWVEKEQRAAAVAVAAHGFLEVMGGARVEADQRLVEDEDPRLDIRAPVRTIFWRMPCE